MFKIAYFTLNIPTLQ
uniref:Uncharacterized protein n=1 Tax=Anguilla anguilla TaxID=7936 RepID=A0A0E9TIR1_ANGAN